MTFVIDWFVACHFQVCNEFWNNVKASNAANKHNYFASYIDNLLLATFART